MHKYSHNIKTAVLAVITLAVGSCKKLIEVPDPINTLTTQKIFSSDAQAEGAMAGIYSVMINGTLPYQINEVSRNSFGAGWCDVAAGLSADELYGPSTGFESVYIKLSQNKLTVINSGATASLWNTAYAAIYGANSVIEGIAASTSPNFRDSARRVLTGEAKFVRAFSYFCLTNFFGDVPLALTIDFNKTVNMSRTPQRDVYKQIAQDLQDAELLLSPGYNTAGERIRPNKWAATALLARVYLYMNEYEKAADKASAVINQSALYKLEENLNDVFRTSSHEAIWQLKQTDESTQLGNATPIGYLMLPATPYTGVTNFILSDNLIHAFEPDDQRYTEWIDSTLNFINNKPTGKTYYPTKYKTGMSNAQFGVAPAEYYMVIRLAEMYLIRAEAKANGATGGPAEAVNDINAIRKRAGLLNFNGTVNTTTMKAAVEKERQVELFTEWGHRWFDLKRTGRAHDVLSSIPAKQPWEGDHQLLYPIPNSEILANHFLNQNSGY